jgi:hypothetical protein
VSWRAREGTVDKLRAKDQDDAHLFPIRLAVVGGLMASPPRRVGTRSSSLQCHSHPTRPRCSRALATQALILPLGVLSAPTQWRSRPTGCRCLRLFGRRCAWRAGSRYAAFPSDYCAQVRHKEKMTSTLALAALRAQHRDGLAVHASIGQGTHGGC